jgi:predicted nucleic acid-binding protein
VILLDTNVISALMRRVPDPVVVGWLDAQPAESIWTTAVTVFEVRLGMELLEPGDRRTTLQQAFDDLLRTDLQDRVVPFDDTAATHAAGIAATRRRSGRTVEFRDVQIAGIAAARRATLATRNIRPFDGLGFALVDPWSERDQD